MRKWILLSLFCLASSAGSVGDDFQARCRTADDQLLTFLVLNVSNLGGIDRVEVSAISAKGAIMLLGKTDSGGYLVVEKEELRELGTTVILFCREGFFCGALRVDLEGDDFYEFSERLIHLTASAWL